MTLAERYAKADLPKLVNVLENPRDFTPECVEVVKAEIASRKPAIELVREEALKIVQEKIKKLFDGYKPYDEEQPEIRSYFLSPEEMQPMVDAEMERWMERHETMRFDVLLYSFYGGVPL
jgi:hypothetical protein